MADIVKCSGFLWGSIPNEAIQPLSHFPWYSGISYILSWLLGARFKMHHARCGQESYFHESGTKAFSLYTKSQDRHGHLTLCIGYLIMYEVFT